MIGFNGTTEWALDSLDQDDALWLPAEDQLRDRLGAAFRRLERTPDGYAVVVDDGDGEVTDHRRRPRHGVRRGACWPGSAPPEPADVRRVRRRDLHRPVRRQVGLHLGHLVQAGDPDDLPAQRRGPAQHQRPLDLAADVGQVHEEGDQRRPDQARAAEVDVGDAARHLEQLPRRDVEGLGVGQVDVARRSGRRPRWSPAVG